MPRLQEVAPVSPWPRWRRAGLPVAAALLAGVAAVVLAPEGRLGCADPYREVSPDGAWSLSLCGRPMWFAMPGGGSDGPAWVVLRDRMGAIRGVCDLDLLQAYGAAGAATEWRPDEVYVPLTVTFPLVPARNAATRWFADRAWRLRALFSLVVSSSEFR